MRIYKKDQHKTWMFFLQETVSFLFFCFMPFVFSPALAQKQVVQVKTFDQDLSPYRNIAISINEGKNISINEKGTAFTELNSTDLPIKSIQVADKQLEAASWNLSKGTLEIIIRKKSYQVVTVVVRNGEDMPMSNLKVDFIGQKKIGATTNAQGFIEIPLALNETINSANQFAINGYETVRIQSANGNYTLIVNQIQPKAVASKKAETVAPKQEPVDETYFKNFDLSKLDSIQSLTVFYAVFKNYQIDEMDADIKRQIDAKFEQLVGQLKDSLSRKSGAVTYMNNISDTTHVEDDMENLLEHARQESQTLAQQKVEFERKIALVNKKLDVGFENLNADERAGLLNEMNLLEKLLKANETEFYKNQNSYHEIINSLKDRFFDLEELEGKLSASEAKRLEEQRVFRQRLFIISGVVIVFAVLIVLLIYFSAKLRKQKKALVVANEEVRLVNENLEAIVHERTKLLEETYKELDTVLYRASHDLRSPVCSIVGLCNIATTVSGEPDELMDRMVKTTTDMDRLLKKLSVISEIHQPGEFSPVLLMDIIGRIQNHFRPFIERHNINFVIDCPDDLVFETIPNLIEIILANLIENALFYCMVKGSDNGEVVLNVKKNNDMLSISLYDNGIGLDVSITKKLFDMFYRGTEHSKGNGLGLYIVQKSVQVLNGNVTVESEQGQFSKFIVELPIDGDREHSFSFLTKHEEAEVV